MDTAGVAVTLIDFTLSRLDTGAGTVAFCDLSADPDLFKGPKNDCQASNSLSAAVAGRAVSCTSHAACCTGGEASLSGCKCLATLHLSWHHRRLSHLSMLSLSLSFSPSQAWTKRAARAKSYGPGMRDRSRD